MLVKASVARSPNQLAQHVRQKVLVAAVARGVPTINDLLKRADEDKSGALSYKEFYTTLRKLLQLTAAAVLAAPSEYHNQRLEFLGDAVNAAFPRGFGSKRLKELIDQKTAGMDVENIHKVCMVETGPGRCENV